MSVNVNILQSFNPYQPGKLILHHTALASNNPERKRFKNIVGKGENAGYQHFLLFLQCFLTAHIQKSLLLQHLICHLQML